MKVVIGQSVYRIKYILDLAATGEYRYPLIKFEVEASHIDEQGNRSVDLVSEYSFEQAPGRWHPLRLGKIPYDEIVTEGQIINWLFLSMDKDTAELTRDCLYRGRIKELAEYKNGVIRDRDYVNQLRPFGDE